MAEEYRICIRLDKRRMKQDGTFPVKLRVYLSPDRIQKYFNTGFSFTEADFDRILNSGSPNQQELILREKLNYIQRYAHQVASQVKPFNMADFEKRFTNRRTADSNVQHLFLVKIGELKHSGQISTEQSYIYTLRTIGSFLEHQQKGTLTDLSVYDITTQWLQAYSDFLTRDVGNSASTTGIYLRNLRHVINRAVESGLLDKKYYPFGKEKFKITPVERNKKSLSKEQVSMLLQSEGLTSEQIKARDFWLLSYWCKGMSMKEIALLKYEHFHADIVHFKGLRSSHGGGGSRNHRFYLNDQVSGVINKYGNMHQFPDNYVFPILHFNDNEEQKYVKIKRFTRFVNQHIKKIARKASLSSEISTDWARQSYLAHTAS